MLLPNPVAFNLFGHPIYWYGVLIAAAVLSAILLCMKRASMYGSNADAIVDLALFVIPSALVGARLYYVVFKWSDFASDPVRALYIWEGGLAFYGGIIGAVIAAVIYCKVKKIPLVSMMDLTAPAIALGQAIGRWGNFINQEAYGVTVTNPSLQFFPISVWIQSSSSWHMATFFYESMFCLGIAIFLLWFAKRNSARGKGTIALLYGLLYGIERAIVEGFRTDSLYIGSLRVSQVLSVLLVIFCAAILIIRWRKSRESIVEVDPNLVMRRRRPDAGEDDALTEEDGEDGAPAMEEKPSTQKASVGNETKEEDDE